MRSIDLAIRKSIGTRSAEVTVDQSLRQSLEHLGDQLDLLESWDSVYACSTTTYVDVKVVQFIDYDGHVSATPIPHNFLIVGKNDHYYR